MPDSKPIIYQLLPRLFTNYCDTPTVGGTLEQNGSGKLNDINPVILGEIRRLGATHVWYTGVIEHAHDADYTAFGITRDNPHVVKGHAGSPYAISDYYDIDPDLAVDVPRRMAEFEALVERTHAAGLKVIIDFVPNHVARRYCSDARPAGIEDLGHGDNHEMFFARDNNFYYITRQQFAPHIDLGSGADAYVEFPAKASGNDCFNAFPGCNDWYDTVKLNYGYDPGDGSQHFDPVPDTWYKMLHILRYWAAKGIDGFRCDMVHMVPLEFWHWAIPQVKQHFPGVVFIAEIYDVGLYRPFIDYGGFDYLYDKVNLYDTLRAIETQNHSAARLTNCWQTVEGIGDRMLNFLENHDEQRFASPFYASDAKRVLPSLVVSTMMSTGPMMIYFGQELGEPGADAEGYSGHDGRTTIFDYWSVASVRRWLNRGACNGALTEEERKLRGIYGKVLRMANEEAAIREGSFFDLMYVNLENSGLNPHRHYAFLRHHGSDTLLIVVNFGDSDDTVRLNIPRHAFTCLDIAEGIDPQAVELLQGTTAPKVFASSEPFVAEVPAHGAVIWKIASERIEPLRPMAPLAEKPKAAAKPAAKPKATAAKRTRKK
ncbi:MAG: alpha-amylase family glycosyl hydrolase [Muribaculaceae bacterium]|nr:alpha-amylase family glycosyl hydrolase [Muribaculaceae bacterium]